MVDHHPRARTRVAGVHSFRDGAPVGLCRVDVAVCAGAVPRVDLVCGGQEASRWYTAVEGGGCEEFGVGGGHDVLGGVSLEDGIWRGES